MQTQAKRKVVALIDYAWIGHHPTYFKMFTRSLLEAGHEVWAFSPAPEEMRQWTQATVDIADVAQLKVFAAPALLRRYSTPMRYKLDSTHHAYTWWSLSDAMLEWSILKQNAAPDMVFFPMLDPLLNGALTGSMVDRLFRYRWSGIYFYPPSSQAQKNKWLHLGVLDPLAALNAKGCKILATLDEESIPALEQRLKKPVIQSPDITDEALPETASALEQQIRSKAAGRPIIGLMGQLGKRKGIDLLLQVMHRLAEEPYFFLIAGECESEAQRVALRAVEAARPQSCFMYLERVPDGEVFNGLVQLSDVGFAVYQQFSGSSNIMTKAAMLGKPLLVAQGNLMAARVEKFKLGIAIPENDVDACVEAVRKLCGQASTSSPEQKAQYQTYFASHSRSSLMPFFNRILQASIV